MSIVFEIWKNNVEYKALEFSSYESGMTIGRDGDPQFLQRFSTKEEAEEEFKRYHSSVCHGSSCAFRLVYVEEYVLWRQEIEIDEDGDIDYLQGEILNISELEG